jgi:hypothetical protein
MILFASCTNNEIKLVIGQAKSKQYFKTKNSYLLQKRKQCGFSAIVLRAGYGFESLNKAFPALIPKKDRFSWSPYLGDPMQVSAVKRLPVGINPVLIGS